MQSSAQLTHRRFQPGPLTGSDNWVECPAFDADTLSGTFLQFGDLDGRQLAPFLVLAPDGLVGNFKHPDVDLWQVVNGRLCFISKSGLPSIIFNVARIENGQVTALAARAVLSGVDAIYVLTRIEHPPHPVAATPASVDRRATFLRQVPAGDRRPNLVVVRAGPTSLHPRWLSDVNAATRSWDLCVSWYGDDLPDASVTADYLTHAPNQRKFKPLFDLFYAGSPLWNYEQIWLPDDDLLVSGSDINLMFHIARKHGLDLAQPSLSTGADSHINHPLTAQRQASIVRAERFVEIMCPLFSARALKICVGSIKDAISGYGLDHLWPSFLGYPPSRIGIIDAMSVIHTRPIGATYDIRSAIAEQAALWKSYGFTYSKIEGVN